MLSEVLKEYMSVFLFFSTNHSSSYSISVPENNIPASC